MANILPGAIWQPINVAGRAARRKGRGLVGHVAVSSSKNLVPGANADWHFYLPKTGPAIQYIDMDLQCWATAAGNASLVAFESEGGLGTEAQVNAEPWTDNQIEWAARILAHLNRTEGVPLEIMPDSRPTSRGFGTHRLGINPWRVADGELWSSAYAKTCPGAAKHAQRIDVVNRARQYAAGKTPGGFLMALSDADQQHLIDMVGALHAVVVNPVKGSEGELLARARTTDAGVAALLARDGSVDAETIAAAIPQNLAQQVIDALGAKLSNS